MIKYTAIIFVGIFMGSCGLLNRNSKIPEGNTQQDYAYMAAFHEGVRFYAKGMDADAERVFRKCLTERPEDDAVHYAMYELLVRKGEAIEALTFIEQASDLDPKNIHYKAELAYNYFDKGDFKASLEYFEQLCEKEPRNIDYRFAMAECYAQLEQYKKAIAAVEVMEGQMGEIPELSIKKFQLYRSMKKESEAIAVLMGAQKKFPDSPQLLGTLVDYYFEQGKEKEAIETLEQMATADPQNGRVHLFLSEVYRQRGDKDRYLISLKKGFLGQGVSLDQKMQALITLQSTGYRLTDDILALAELLANQHPNEAKPHSIKGDFLMQMDRDEEALLAYEEALKFEKSAYPIWNQVLIMLYQKGSWKKLLSYSKECLEYFPSLPTPYLLLGVAANQEKDHQLAVDKLENGLIYLQNDKALEAEFHAQLGEAYFGLDQIEKGKENYTLALEKDRNSTLIRNNYAYRLAQEKVDFDLALQMIDEAILRDGGQAHYIDTKGFILFQQGKYDEAKELFEQAIDMNPEQKDAEILEHLADAQFKLGNTEEAVKLWKEAKDLGSKSPLLDKKIETKTYVESVE